jgi:HNH endonuclease
VRIDKDRVWCDWFGTVRTGGACCYCRRRLVFEDYGNRSIPGGWEVEHLIARANGGHPFHRNNLAVACWHCNAEKGARRGALQERRRHGFGRALLRFKQAQRVRMARAPFGAAIVGAASALVGASIDPEIAVGVGMLGGLAGLAFTVLLSPHPR